MREAHSKGVPRHPWQFQLRHLLWFVLGAALVLTLTLQLRLWGAILALLVAACGLAARRRLVAELAIAVPLGLAALYLLYGPSGDLGSESGQADACQDQLRRIALALAQYRAEHGHLPPPCTQDASGRPLHSWRALILPYLPGTGAVSGRYRYDEPWDGPNNRRLHGEACAAFRCPADDGVDSATTSYLAIVGPGAAWHNSADEAATDGQERLLIVEVSGSNIRWYEPLDLPAESLRPAAHEGVAAGNTLAARHRVRGASGAFAVFASGQVRFIDADVDAELLHRWAGAGGRAGRGDVPDGTD